MIKYRDDFNSKNIINICVDYLKDEEISGRIYYLYSHNFLSFVDINQLLIIMGDIFDVLKYPESSTQIRSFSTTKNNNTMKEIQKERVCMSMNKLKQESGGKGTFIVHVQCRQNSTWQGSVNWGEKNITKNFRSALELVKLIESALNEDKENETEVE